MRQYTDFSFVLQQINITHNCMFNKKVNNQSKASVHEYPPCVFPKQCLSYFWHHLKR